MTGEQLKALGYVEYRGEYFKADSVPQSPVAQPPLCNESLAEEKRKALYTGRVHIVVTSFRNRLCDPDNLCPKYFIDCLRYAGIIQNDTPEHITLEIRQEKCPKKNERTEILITPK